MFLQIVGRVGIVVCCVIAVVLIAIVPIKMGRDANKNIPIIAELEQIGQEYCEVTLKRATVAYIISKTIDKIVSMIQRTELTFAPFGIGLTVAPGEMLAAVNDAISRFCAAFFWVIGITLLGQLAAGMLTFVCIKVLLPASLICIALYNVFPRHFQWAKNIAALLMKITLVAFLFFPTVALVTSYINNAYLSSEYTKNIKELNEYEVQLVREQTDVLTIPETKNEQNTSWWGRIKEGIKVLTSDCIKKILAEKIDKIVNFVDGMLDKLFALLVIFLLTTCVIPLAVLFLMISVVRVFAEQYRQAENMRALRELYEKQSVTG